MAEDEDRDDALRAERRAEIALLKSDIAKLQDQWDLPSAYEVLALLSRAAAFIR